MWKERQKKEKKERGQNPYKYVSQFKQNSHMIWRPGELLIELNILMPYYAEDLRAYKKNMRNHQELDHVYPHA